MPDLSVPGPQRRHLFVLSALALLAFAPTLRTGFMIDDPFLLAAVAPNPGWSASAVRSDFTQSVYKQGGGFYYRPMLSLMVRGEYGLFGNHPAGYHAVTILFHWANVLLLYVILQRLGISAFVSALTAALFATTPILVDDFLAATGGDAMANFFFWASIYCFLDERPWWGWCLAFPAFFAKESAVMLPFQLALFFSYMRKPRSEYWKVAGLVLPLAVFGWMRMRSVHWPPGMTLPVSVQFTAMAFPKIAFCYLRTLIAPVGLETWPPIVHLSHLWPVYGAGLIVIAWWVSLVPMGRLSAAWYLLGLLPRIPAMIVGNVLMDKWAVISAPAIFLPLATVFAKGMRSRSVTKRLAWCGFAGIVIWWMSLGYLNIRRRGSDEKNYRWTIRHGVRDFASYRLGIILLRQGRAAEAVDVLTALNAWVPGDPDYEHALALALQQAGRAPHRRDGPTGRG